MFDEVDDAEVVTGPPESWNEFADRMQRQVGKGSKVFVCQQVGTADKARPFIMILSGGPIRDDLISEVMK